MVLRVKVQTNACIRYEPTTKGYEFLIEREEKGREGREEEEEKTKAMKGKRESRQR